MEFLTDWTAWPALWMDALRTYLGQHARLASCLDALRLALPLALLMAFTGLSLISAAARLRALRLRRSSYDKCARQLSLLALWMGWLLLVGGRVWLFAVRGGMAPDALPDYLLESAWLLLGAAVLGLSLYHALWKPLARKPVPHALLAGGCCTAALLALGCAMAVGRLHAGHPLPDAADLPRLCTLAGMPQLCALAMTPALVTAMAGGMGALWLVLRRRHDDFGRDHYNTMLPWCAAWARNGWLPAWLALLGLAGADVLARQAECPFDGMDALWTSVWLVVWLLPGLLWHLAARSRTPLRHKAGLLLALLLALSAVPAYHAAMTGQAAPSPLTPWTCPAAGAPGMPAAPEAPSPAEKPDPAA